jgi:hypothetical protein
MTSWSWIAASESASNQRFLDWRRRVSKKFEPGQIDMAGYALHAHPDLTDALVEVGNGLRAQMVAAYGVPAMERPGPSFFSPGEIPVKLELEDRTKADQRAWMEKLQAFCASAYGAI